MKANRTITRENAMRVLYQIFLYKKNKIDYTTNGVIEEYMDNIPYYNSTNNKDLSLSIEKLIDFNVFDYDEYSYSLLLSDDYNAHLQTYTDVNEDHR